MRPGWKWVAAMSVLVLGIVVSVSGAATSGSQRDGGSGSEAGSERRALRAPLPPPGGALDTLAGELGVSEEKLRDALAAVREDLGPPRRGRRAQRPTRAQMERRCNEFTDALAKELGKDGDEVRTAIKSAARKSVEEAVDDGRLTRAQGDRILSRLDERACVPAFGLHRRGCGGPGGRDMRPAPAPGGSGSEGSSFVPAPSGAPA